MRRYYPVFILTKIKSQLYYSAVFPHTDRIIKAKISTRKFFSSRNVKVIDLKGSEMEIDLSQLPRKVRRYDITEERGFRGKVYKHLIPYDNFERKSTVEILDELLSDWIGSLDKL